MGDVDPIIKISMRVMRRNGKNGWKGQGRANDFTLW